MYKYKFLLNILIKLKYKMDDFLTGPASFDLYLKTSDRNVLHNGHGGFSFVLQKPLEFSSEWEVGVKQLIAKSPNCNKGFRHWIYITGNSHWK